MKHITTDDTEWLAGLISEADVSVAPEAMRLMLRHIDWLIDTNRSLNLTAVDEPREALRLHLLDSLIALPEVSGAPAGSLLDIGTGGGVPGIELASVTGRQTVLVDSVKKKAAAVRAFVVQENLESRISVSELRAEEIARHTPESSAVVTARAVAALPVLVELAAPLLFLGGRLVALKARPTAEEIAAGDRAAEVCGMKRLSVREQHLPGGGELRTILVYARTGPHREALPRRNGMANKNPLG